MRTVVLLVASILAACTRSQQTTSDRYWWLGLKKSPFGGRNYNLDEVSVTSSSEHSQQWHCTLNNESSFLLLLGAGVWGCKNPIGVGGSGIDLWHNFLCLKKSSMSHRMIKPLFNTNKHRHGGPIFHLCHRITSSPEQCIQLTKDQSVNLSLSVPIYLKTRTTRVK